MGEKKSFSGGQLLSRNVYKYDKMNMLTEADFYSKDSSSYDKHVYLYNGLGQEVECDIYEGGNFSGKIIKKYDEKGHEIEWLSYNQETKLDRKDVSIYNAKGVIQEQDWYNETGLYRKYTYEFKFDKKGNWIERIANENGHYTVTIREISYH
jgi:hypothetical protein